MPRTPSLALLILTAIAAAAGADEPPRPVDERLKIELFAVQPQIATPTGLDVDHAGRVWAIESNTHFRPDGYPGHPTDRLLVLEDTNGDHQADKITTFPDGFTHAMSVAVEPVWLELNQEPRDKSQEPEKKHGSKTATNSNSGSGLSTLDSLLSVFVATRSEILLLTDVDGDLKADRRERLVHLDTSGNYPHNGLAGFAFDAMGWMYFGFGENLGASYRIVGSDGVTLSGGGEGGNLYRCRPDGSKLELWATGFWNPHASCFDAFGRLFSVDNDPDSRPPCRLLHVIKGGDYGYRFRNGRKGTHPFTSWNGELPGTLPMVAGTGEAPSGIVCYESDGLPPDYLGTLLVTSWGDHRIDRFRLTPKGASFTSKAEPIIQGGENFRPVGLALAPDGSLYCTDWVLKDYKLHGKGRIWRIAAGAPNDTVRPSADGPPPSPSDLLRKIRSSSLTTRRQASRELARHPDGRLELLRLVRERKEAESVRSRIEAYWAIQQAALDPQSLAEFNAILPQVPSKRAGKIDELEVEAERLAREAFLNGREHRRLALAFPSSTESYASISPALLLARLHNETRSEETLGTRDGDHLARLLEDPFIFHAEVMLHARIKDPAFYRFGWDSDLDPIEKCRLFLLLAQRKRNPRDTSLLNLQLTDPSLAVRRAAVQWIGDENLKEFRPQVEALLSNGAITHDLFMACLATLSLLDGVPAAEFEKKPPTEYVLAMVRDEKRPAGLRARALRMLPPAEKQLDAKLLGSLLKSEDPELRLEAVRTLQYSPLKEREELLRPIAADAKADTNLRAEAIAGLAGVDHHARLNETTRDLLLELASDDDPALQIEALRALRGNVAHDDKSKRHLEQLSAATIDRQGELTQQLTLALASGGRQPPDFPSAQRSPEESEGSRPPLAKDTLDELAGGDPAAGRRIFYHANSAGCYKCHTVNGRGGAVGPDLSVIARTMDRKKLAESILEPSKEVSPQFTTWTIVMTSGQVHTGLILAEEPDGRIIVGDAEGRRIELKESDIEERQPQKTSLMPEKLVDRLTTGELRDLLAFLETLK